MEKEEIRTETPLVISGITLVPIVKTRIYCQGTKGWLFTTGAKKPFCIVVVSPQEKKALLVDGDEIPLEQLYEEAPGVKAILEAI